MITADGVSSRITSGTDRAMTASVIEGSVCVRVPKTNVG